MFWIRWECIYVYASRKSFTVRDMGLVLPCRIGAPVLYMYYKCSCWFRHTFSAVLRLYTWEFVIDVYMSIPSSSTLERKGWSFICVHFEVQTSFKYLVMYTRVCTSGSIHTGPWYVQLEVHKSHRVRHGGHEWYVLLGVHAQALVCTSWSRYTHEH